MSLAEWHRRYQAQMTAPGRKDARVVFVGDSITEGWGNSESYARAFAQYHPLNLGIGGDQTQHVLWRIDQGALDGVHPAMVVVMIGVNNLGDGFSPDETFRGVRRVVESIEERLPSARILLLSILPAGRDPQDPQRARIAVTNEKLQTLERAGHVHVVDLGKLFLEPDGHIDSKIMGDYLHPTSVGYERLSAAVAPLIEPSLSSEATTQ